MTTDFGGQHAASTSYTTRASSPRRSEVAGKPNGDHLPPPAPSSDLLTLPPSTDPQTLTTPAEVRRALEELEVHSVRVDKALDAAILSSTSRIQQSQQRIASFAPQIDLLTEEGQVLQARLVEAALTSDRISGAVRVLDEERRRIRLASEWVTWTQDLKGSLASLASAVDQGDWETATRHAQKAMGVPVEVIESEFAMRVVPTTEQPLPPAQTLLELRSVLLRVFTPRFQQAAESKDEAEASKFFKMFPLVGWRNEGLAAYCTFARGMIREKGKVIIEATGRGGNTPLHHAHLLTALFEQLALLIDTHQAVVDRHYGKGNFAAGVMPGLQEECDYIGTRIIDSWIEKTSIVRRLDESRAFTFHFLANLGSSNTAGRSSVRITGAGKPGAPGRPGTPVGGFNRPSTPSNAPEEPQAPDGREVDRLLTELATMAARWATYQRFLRGRLEVEPSAQRHSIEQDTEDSELKDYRRGSVDSRRRDSIASMAAADAVNETAVTAEKVLETSALRSKMDNLLEDMYCPLERWYLRSSLEKAHRIDTADLAARPLTSSILDDAFFLLRATLTRILSTAHLGSISSSLRTFRTIADEDYVQILVRRMETTWRNVGGAMAGPDGPRKETASREMRTQFVLYLNVLSISATYAERILGDLSSDSHLSTLFSTPTDLTQVSSRMSELSALPNRLRSAMHTELEHLFTQLSKPRLRSLLLDAYRDVSYSLSEEEFQEAEYQDLFFRRFCRIFHHLLANLRDLFTESNFDLYFALCVEHIVRPWERMLLGSASASSSSSGEVGSGSGSGGGSRGGMRFTELGALRFDKDWRSVAKYLGDQTSSAEVRDKFARLQQIAYVLSLDEDDDEGIYESGASSGFSWRLSASEVRAVRALRV